MFARTPTHRSLDAIEEALRALPSAAPLPWTRALRSLARALSQAAADADHAAPPVALMDALSAPPAGLPFRSGDDAADAVKGWREGRAVRANEPNRAAELWTRADAAWAERQTSSVDAEQSLRRVLLLAPNHGEAHARLARLYRERAEESGDDTHWRAMCAWHDVGAEERWLRGEVRLRVGTLPSGARAVLRRPNGDHLELGTTPAEAVVPPGEGTLELTHGELRLKVPVHFERGEERTDDPPYRLLARGTLPAGWSYVPAGSFIYGGDPDADYPLPRQRLTLPAFAIATHPVTMAEYTAFLNAVHARSPSEAAARAPRRVLRGGGAQPLMHPTSDADAPYPEPPDLVGRCPVVGVSFEDATAYAAWRSEVEGAPITLPTERQWEKAARGVDGRLFPWGDDFDASRCNMRHSRARPGLLPVGSVTDDVSPFGMHDAAGNVLELCAPGPDPVPAGGVPVRGGAWHSSPQACRVADRFGMGPRYVDPALGFRLAREVEPVEACSTSAPTS